MPWKREENRTFSEHVSHVRLCSRHFTENNRSQIYNIFVSALKTARYVTLDNPLLRSTTQFIHCVAWQTEYSIILSICKYPNTPLRRPSVTSKDPKATQQMWPPFSHGAPNRWPFQQRSHGLLLFRCFSLSTSTLEWIQKNEKQSHMIVIWWFCPGSS